MYRLFISLEELKLKDFGMNLLFLLQNVNGNRVVAPFVGMPFVS